jgi:hypothetical protein
VKLVACRFLSALFLAAFVGGCGGCQPGSVPESGDSSGARKPAAAGTAAAGAATPGKTPQALPTARELPTMKGAEHAPAAGPDMQQQAAPGQEPAAEEEPEEADCSVIADAEPDYGPPPLTVHFSVDYECTEGSATVRWDFGDHSGASTDDNPMHTYREGGEFTAVVTVTTPDGASATDEIDITVEAEDESVPDVEPENP